MKCTKQFTVWPAWVSVGRAEWSSKAVQAMRGLGSRAAGSQAASASQRRSSAPVVVGSVVAHDGYGLEQAHRKAAAAGHELVGGALPDKAGRVGRDVLLAPNGHSIFTLSRF